MQRLLSFTGASETQQHTGTILKIAVFATGCAGIVAEFVLSTLATYLIGNAIFQWTVVMSLMLFAMGVGSRVSRYFQRQLLDTFVIIEFCLSILCALSSVLAYSMAALISYIEVVIYAQAFVIGMLIGFEIPLVTRLNEAYEELRINISGIMEKDYYGALLGGITFAIALPYLGLTYIPLILGSINFFVASIILWRFFMLIHRKRSLAICFSVTLISLITIGIFGEPVITYGEQSKYKDKVIYSKQTPYQKIVMTQWKSYYWLYLNAQEQFSTYDEEKYHEPLVHPAMILSPDIRQVLILGGGDGLAAREVLKHLAVESITLVDLDREMTTLAQEHPILLTLNNGSLNHRRVTIINRDASTFIQNDSNLYGVILCDLPDPDSIDMMHVYSKEFYETIRDHLIRGGIFVTQATSPYFTKDAFLSILKTMKAAGFSVLPYHNQIPTMGEWGWVLGIRAEDVNHVDLKELMITKCKQFPNIDTRFLNTDAILSMIHFGKGTVDDEFLDAIDISTKINPVLYRYYQRGTWGLY